MAISGLMQLVPQNAVTTGGGLYDVLMSRYKKLGGKTPLQVGGLSTAIKPMERPQKFNLDLSKFLYNRLTTPKLNTGSSQPVYDISNLNFPTVDLYQNMFNQLEGELDKTLRAYEREYDDGGNHHVSYETTERLRPLLNSYAALLNEVKAYGYSRDENGNLYIPTTDHPAGNFQINLQHDYQNMAADFMGDKNFFNNPLKPFTSSVIPNHDVNPYVQPQVVEPQTTQPTEIEPESEWDRYLRQYRENQSDRQQRDWESANNTPSQQPSTIGIQPFTSGGGIGMSFNNPSNPFGGWTNQPTTEGTIGFNGGQQSNPFSMDTPPPPNDSLQVIIDAIKKRKMASKLGVRI